jgi:hypothetical protein
VPAKESLALTEAVEAPEVSLAPDFMFAAFSRMAASFWALGPSPPILIAPGLGMKSLMRRFSHARWSFRDTPVAG